MRTIALIIVLFSSAFASAQHVRYWNIYHSDPNQLWTSLKWHANDVGTSDLVIRQDDDTTVYPTTNLALPIAAPGDLDLIKIGHGEFFLCGSDKLILLRADAARNFFVAWTHTVAGANFVGVDYCEPLNRIYLLDSNKNLTWASYSPGGSSPSPWHTLIAPASFPDVGPVIEYSLSVMDVTSGVVTMAAIPGGGGVYDRLEIVHTLPGSPPGTATTTIQKSVAKCRAYISDSNWLLNPGQTSVNVTALSGSTVDVMRIDVTPPVSVGSVGITGPVGEQGSANATTTPLEWGAIYGAKSSTGNLIDAPIYTPQLVWDSIETLPNGVTIEPWGPLVGLDCFVGNGSFDLRLDLTLTSLAAAAGPVSYPVVLGIAVDDPQNRPIDFSGPTPLLIPALTFNYTLNIDAQAISYYVPGFQTHGHAGLAPVVPIPNDPILAGTVFLFQYAIWDGVTYVLSDITGAIVQASEYDPFQLPIDCNGVSLSLGGGGNNLQPKYGPEVSARGINALRAAPRARVLSEEERRQYVQWLREMRSPRR